MFEDPRSLSDWLREQIDVECRVADLQIESDRRELAEELGKLTSALVNSLESFQEDDFSHIRVAFEKLDPRFLTYQLDFHFTTELIQRVPKFVERALSESYRESRRAS